MPSPLLAYLPVNAPRPSLFDLRDRIAGASGATVPVAALIRGVLDAVADARLDLSRCGSEADIKAAVLARLRRR